MDAFRNVLLGFAAVALFVSAFFINNTFSIVVGQRTRQLALLRSLGASPPPDHPSVVGEALVVGALASVVGIGFGLVIAIGLQAIFQAAGLRPARTGPRARPPLARRRGRRRPRGHAGRVLAPARRASSVAPVEGMREGFVPSPGPVPPGRAAAPPSPLAGAALVVAGLFVVEATDDRGVPPRRSGPSRCSSASPSSARSSPSRWPAPSVGRSPRCSASPAAWPTPTPSATLTAPPRPPRRS